MKTGLIRTLVAVTGLGILLAGPAAPASEPEGEIFDQDSFQGGVPSGWRPSSDFNSCEFKRESREGRHVQQIYSAKKDKCDTHTTGAPKFGDVSIYRTYDANGGEVYKAWARGYIFAPVKARATVKIIFFDNDQAGKKGVAECWDRTESTESDVMETGEYKKGLNGNDKPVVTESNGCTAPSGVDGVSIHYRIHAIEGGASGKAVLQRLKFGRCNDNGDCSNVPGF